MSDGANGQMSDADQAFSEDFVATADALVRRYPVARSALLPLLHLVQAEHGYVSDAGIAFCAERLALTRAEVGAVATFYTMFKRAPVGDYLLSVCTNPTCKLAGAQGIFERYRKALGGHLTDLDTGVSIEEAECLGICDAAPVVQVNYDMYGPLTDDEADRLLAGCRKGAPPVSSWSDEPAPTFREVERELSGANDTFLDANAAASRRSVEYPVPPAYKTGETDIPVTAPGGDPAGHGGALFAENFGASRPVPDADQAADDAADDAPAPDEVEASSLAIGGDTVLRATREPSTTGHTEPGAAYPAPEADATQGSPGDEPGAHMDAPPADDQSEEA